MDLGIRGRTCLVTGASSGIGLATARTLAAEGGHVLMAARDEQKLGAAAESIEGDAVALALDITDPDAPAAVLAAVAGGAIDILVNNAGTSAIRPLEDLTDEDWQRQWELHVLAPLRFMRALCPLMRERGWGRVVNVSSTSGKRPSATNAAYSVTKAAELSLSRTFADAYAASGVTVNAVCPGPVETPLWLADGGLAEQIAGAAGSTREQALEHARAAIPRGRFGSADEVAAVIVFLCSELAANVLGAAWSVDGGAVPVII